jgi:methyl-accepting chemotaxis protein
LREQAEKLSFVIQDNTLAVRAAAVAVEKSGELSERLIEKVESLDESVKKNGEHIDRLASKMDAFGEAFKELRVIFYKPGKGDNG